MQQFISTLESSASLIEENKNIRFIIPAYQRPYVWGKEEIYKFLEDIYSAHSQSNESYFIGNIYVSRTNNANIFEVVDGQQRFTTFWLISLALKKIDASTSFVTTRFLTVDNLLRLNFSIRSQVSQYLLELLNNENIYLGSVKPESDEFLKYIAEGIETIKGFLQVEETRKDGGLERLSNFIFTKVQFVFNVAPEHTDLNSLFTSLGSSGIQLEQTDILKALLLKKVENKVSLSKLWESCENMNQYFEDNIKDCFGANYDLSKILSTTFSEFSKPFFENSNEPKNEEDTSSRGQTILEIINGENDKFNEEENKINEKLNENKCRSIIPFSVLLLHTYRIFRWNSTSENIKTDFNIPFDKKNLLEIFTDLINENDDVSNEKISKFFKLLFQIRYVFDKHVIKWTKSNNDEDEYDDDEMLRLTSIQKNDNGLTRYLKAISPLSQLQSVLYFTGNYNQQFWLTPFLDYLINNEEATQDVILEALEKIDNQMLPGEKKAISWTLLHPKNRNRTVDNIKEKASLEKSFGTGFNHYWFYKLEYLLWKEWDKNDDRIKGYRITSKNSIEHVFPQNHEFGLELDKSWLNSFGNLGLISVGQNSSYSNQDVRKKQIDFNDKKTYDSLKLAKIYTSKILNDWHIDDIKKHQAEMIDLFEEHYLATPLLP